MEDRIVYPSSFGDVDLTFVPSRFRPQPPALEADLERTFAAGGSVDGPARVQVNRDVTESGEQIGWIVYLRVPFRGHFLHEIRRLDLRDPDAPDPNAPAMA